MNRSVQNAIVWIVLVVIGLSLISFYRRHQFQEEIEKTITEIEEKIEEYSVELKTQWETLDKSNPVAISHYFESEIKYPYFIYFLNYCKYLQNQKEGNLFIGTFQIQAYRGSLLESYFILYLAQDEGAIEWDCDRIKSGFGGNYCTLLLDYAEEYENTNQKFNWEEFENSDEFKEFLNDFYYSVENKEGTTLGEAYQFVKGLEGVDPKNVYREASLQSYRYLAETGYINYYMHKDQNDFVKVLMDAKVVYVTYWSSETWDTKMTVFTTLMPVYYGYFYVHSSILDVVAVLGGSTLIVVVVWIVTKNKSLHSD